MPLFCINNLCVYRSSTCFSPLNNMPGRVTSIYTCTIFSWSCCSVFCCMEGFAHRSSPPLTAVQVVTGSAIDSGAERKCMNSFPVHCGACPVWAQTVPPLIYHTAKGHLSWQYAQAGSGALNPSITPMGMCVRLCM